MQIDRTEVVAFTASATKRAQLALGLIVASALLALPLEALRFATHGAINRVADSVWEIGRLIDGVSMIAFLVWLHRAFVVARDALGGKVPASPGVAVAGFFIPLLNLYLPYAMLNGLRDASDPTAFPPVVEMRASPTAGYRDPAQVAVTSWVPPRSVIGAWWASWLVWHLGGSFIAAAMVGADGEHGLAISATLSSGMMLVTAVLAIMVIRGIDGMQRERARRIAAQS